MSDPVRVTTPFFKLFKFKKIKENRKEKLFIIVYNCFLFRNDFAMILQRAKSNLEGIFISQ
ncbi:hypothetical protein D9V87_10790 [Bacteroidetes/Chlorobi group bacterium MS-B_bin-24]|nr:MAG: hypothetical protein D9V87_10790 [Bacteroidetes/Chlorobi group bacterium MS-B_bin-24]